MDTRPIGVFDSGFGGLTVLSELVSTFPHENFIYFGAWSHPLVFSWLP
jgi:glutamate racemase